MIGIPTNSRGGNRVTSVQNKSDFDDQYANPSSSRSCSTRFPLEVFKGTLVDSSLLETGIRSSHCFVGLPLITNTFWPVVSTAAQSGDGQTTLLMFAQRSVCEWFRTKVV